MGGERQSSKSGRYVGGFLQLFDWNQKSRKKLFSGKSDLPEQPRHGRRSEGNSPITRVCMFDDEEIVGGLSIRVGSEYSYSCASSVTDEDGYGTKAPSVVAKLMGLDSLPTSNTSEPYSSPQFETPSLRDAPPFRRKELDFYHKYQVRSSENLVLKTEGPSHYASSEPKNPKILNRAVQKFQTEILPPKSAKSIPLTHNKLLSPIRNPGFLHSKDAAQIMEAAARIIEPAPQASSRTKISTSSSRSSSSVPLRVQEMREKLEASQRSTSRASQMLRRPVESNAAKCLKGQSLNKSWNGSVETSSKSSCDAEDSSFSSKNKGKSISLAIQAKVNVQKRGLSRSSGRNSEARKEEDEVRSGTQFKSQPNNQRTTTHKKTSSSSRNATVLKQNNQKQNCHGVTKDSLHSKHSAPTSDVRKGSSAYNSTSQQQQYLNRDQGSIRMGSRKSSLEIRDQDRDGSYAKIVPRKKRSFDGQLQQHVRNHNNYAGKSEKLFQSSVLPDSHHLPWAEETRKKGMDVVSFTFTAPMTRSVPGLESSSSSRLLSEKNNSVHFTENRNKKAMLNPDSPKQLSSLGYNNMMGGDALSVLLEQKLKELTHATEPSSEHMFTKSGRFDSSSQQNAVFSCSGNIASETFQSVSSQLEMQQMDSTPGEAFSHCSTEPEIMRRNRFNLQAGEEIDACSSSKTDTRPLLSDRRYPSPVSILETSESCNSSSDSVGSNLTEECKQLQCSSVRGQEVVGLTSSYTETDLTDSASSTKSSSSSSKAAVNNSREWELKYIKEILSNVELMFMDYACGRTSKIINPHIFHQLERKKETIKWCEGEEFNILKRRAVFDCVSECLEVRCRVFVEGGSSAWAKGLTMVKRKERLAEEICKEIENWRRMGDCMVDELVEKDMGSKYGNWLDFEADGFGVGGEVENLIFDALVEEMVGDVLATKRCFSRCSGSLFR